MATCKDCIHYDICIFHLKGNENKECVQFRNKADVVEVVRCKDCKYAEVCETQCGAKYIECQSHEVYMEADDYCSYGERKETKDEA